MYLFEFLLKEKLEEIDRKINFLTTRSNDMTGEVQELKNILTAEHEQFNAAVQALNDKIAALEAIAPKEGDVVISRADFEELKALGNAVVPDPAPAEITPEVPADSPVAEQTPADNQAADPGIGDEPAV